MTFLAAADKWTKRLNCELKDSRRCAARSAMPWLARSKGGRPQCRWENDAPRAVRICASGGAAIFAGPPGDLHRAHAADRPDGRLVFRSAAAPAPPIALSDGAAELTVRIAVVDGSAADIADLAPDAAKFDVVGQDQQADLVWDAGNGDVISRLGDVVAHNVKPRDLLV